MIDAPVPLILDLWSLGHSASDVARRTGIKRKRVTVIVAQARAAGDPRAVLHCSATGRPYGRAGWMENPPLEERVPAKRAMVCSRGHFKTRFSIAKNSQCLRCKRLLDKKRSRSK